MATNTRHAGPMVVPLRLDGSRRYRGRHHRGHPRLRALWIELVAPIVAATGLWRKARTRRAATRHARRCRAWLAAVADGAIVGGSVLDLWNNLSGQPVSDEGVTALWTLVQRGHVRLGVRGPELTDAGRAELDRPTVARSFWRGLWLAVLLAAPFWVLIGLAVWWLW